MNTITLGKLACGSVLLLTTACGGDDEGGGDPPAANATVKSGVPPEKTVNTLSEAEAKQVSASFAQAIQTSGLIDAMCTFNGIIGEQLGAATGTPTTCEQIVTDCKAAPTEATDSAVSVQDDPAQLSACTVTVGELEGCLNALLTQLKQSVSGVNCDSELQTVVQSFSTATDVAACEKVNTTCPTLLSAGGGATTP